MEIRQIIMIQRRLIDGVSRASTVIAFIVLLIVAPAAWVYAEREVFQWVYTAEYYLDIGG